jgi:hypothetical protein
MLDVQVPALPAALGKRLVSADYKREFRERDAGIRDGRSWKLERLQHFEEVSSASRDALRRGDWAEALRLMDAGRERLREFGVEEAARGAVFHRVRVVEEPLTPYLQWELHSLRVKAEYGERVRVLPAAAVAGAESGGPLPDAGVPDGALRFTDPGVVAAWEAYVEELYGAAEDLHNYFDRAVADLPPPPAA